MSITRVFVLPYPFVTSFSRTLSSLLHLLPTLQCLLFFLLILFTEDFSVLLFLLSSVFCPLISSLSLSLCFSQLPQQPTNNTVSTTRFVTAECSYGDPTVSTFGLTVPLTIGLCKLNERDGQSRSRKRNLRALFSEGSVRACYFTYSSTSGSPRKCRKRRTRYRKEEVSDYWRWWWWCCFNFNSINSRTLLILRRTRLLKKQYCTSLFSK